MRSKIYEEALRTMRIYFELREPIKSENRTKKLSRNHIIASILNETLASNQNPDYSGSVSWENSEDQVTHTTPELLSMPLYNFLDIEKLKKEADRNQFERGQIAWLLAIAYFQQAFNGFQKDVWWTIDNGNQILKDGTYWLGQAQANGIVEAQKLWVEVSRHQPYTPLTFEWEGKKLFTSFYSKDRDLENVVFEALLDTMEIDNINKLVTLKKPDVLNIFINNAKVSGQYRPNKGQSFENMSVYLSIKQAIYHEFGMQKNIDCSKRLAAEKLAKQLKSRYLQKIQLDEARIAMKEGFWLKGIHYFSEALLLETGKSDALLNEAKAYKVDFKVIMKEVEMFKGIGVDKAGKLLAALLDTHTFAGKIFAYKVTITKEILRDLVFSNPSDEIRKDLLIRALGFDTNKSAAENMADPLYKILRVKRMKSGLFEESMVVQFEKALFAMDKSYIPFKGKSCCDAIKVEDFVDDFMVDYEPGTHTQSN